MVTIIGTAACFVRAGRSLLDLRSPARELARRVEADMADRFRHRLCLDLPERARMCRMETAACGRWYFRYRDNELYWAHETR